MHDTKRRYVNLYELLNCLTDAVDLVNHKLTNHHQEVAYMAYHIAETLGLSIEKQQEVVFAGLLHDIGAVSVAERMELIENEQPSAQDHAFRSAHMLEGIPQLENIAEIIKYHHVSWNCGKGRKFFGRDVPLLSNVLHLADRSVLLLNKEKEAISQIPDIQNTILSEKNTRFNPEVVDAFLTVSSMEYIWMDITYRGLYSTMKDFLLFDTLDLELDEVILLTKIFAKVIDSRSHFTANHSAGVAETARKLAMLIGFSENDSKLMLVAGYIHDLGKLVVDNNILEKKGTLDNDEYNLVKSHAYYTYRILQSITGWQDVNEWASFHHERLNGEGYPFHLTSKNLSLGSRIMAVADVYTAISEDRPYRKGMSKEQAIKVLEKMVKNGELCSICVSRLVENFVEIDRIRIEAQQKDREIRKMKSM